MSGLASLSVALGACGGTNGSNSGGGQPLVIGVSVSLSGDFSADGKAVEQGYDLWAEDVNSAGGLLGRKVVLKYVDDASSAQQVVTNYQNLITVDHVDLTFGPYSSLLTIPASGVAARYGYAFPEPAGGGPQVFQRGLHNLFFVQPAPVVDNLVSYTEWLRSLPAGQRPKTAAYATEDDPFTQPQVDTAKTKLEAAGVTTAYYKVYPAEATDITPTALGAAKSNADVVVLGTQLADGIGFIKTFQQQRYSPKSLIEAAGPDQGSQFSDEVGKAAADGSMVPPGWRWPSPSTRSRIGRDGRLLQPVRPAPRPPPGGGRAFTSLLTGLVLEAAVLGVLTGGVYALMATGLTLIFGVMRIINVGQGAMVVLGAYLSLVLLHQWGIDPFLGLLITMPTMFVLGVGIELVFIRPLKSDREALSVLVTYALALGIEGVLTYLFSANYQQLTVSYDTAGLELAGLHVTYVYVFGFLLCLAIQGALFLLLYRTTFGASVRATMLNRSAARLIGIDVERVSALAFGSGMAT